MNEKENHSTINLNNQTFWIEIQEVGNNLEKLSTKINGQHYIGFPSWYERKEQDGTIRKWKSARMRPCDWEKCQTCHPQETEIF